jgi:hypothetical protein
VAGDIEFTGPTSHGLIGETGQHLTLTTAGVGDIVMNTAGLTPAVTIDNASGKVTAAGALEVSGISTFTGEVAGNIDFNGAASHSVLGEDGQTLIINGVGTGHLHLGVASDPNAIEIEDVAGAVTVNQALTAASTLAVTSGATLSSTLQVDGAISCGTGGGAPWTITGPTDQNTVVTAPASRSITIKSNNVDALVCTTAANIEVPNDLSFLGDSGGKLTMKFKTVELTGMTGATVTATNFIPAGAIVMSLCARVTTLITSGAGVSWDLGHAGDTDEWGTGLAFAAGTTVDSTDWTAGTNAGINYPAATSVILDCDGANTFTAGAVRLSMWYYETTAPTS